MGKKLHFRNQQFNELLATNTENHRSPHFGRPPDFDGFPNISIATDSHIPQPSVPRPTFRSNSRPSSLGQFLDSKMPDVLVNPMEFVALVTGCPPHWTTSNFYKHFESCGNLVQIKIVDRGTNHMAAFLSFRPPPDAKAWSTALCVKHDGDEGDKCFVLKFRDVSKPLPSNSLPVLTLNLQQLDFGYMEDEDSMLVMQTVHLEDSHNLQMSIDLLRKELVIHFHAPVDNLRRQFKMTIKLAQMQQVLYTPSKDEGASLVVPNDMPPMVFRKLGRVVRSNEESDVFWNEKESWYRQTNIDSPGKRERPIRLDNGGQIVDIGRWLTYRLYLDKATIQSNQFKDICQVIADHNIKFIANQSLAFRSGTRETLWSFMGDEIDACQSSLAQMQEMTSAHSRLSFATRYNLELCLSLRVVLECSIDQMFMEQLRHMDQRRAAKVLEKAAASDRHFYKASAIFQFQNEVSVAEETIPKYCARIPAIAVTPTTVRYLLPVLETSNRVVRQFRQYQDRFLRVKFTDEKYKGKLLASDGSTTDQLFSRVFRTLKQGVHVGGRHYEFLAFGNSQFRENGAYFFASTATITAETIRQWMGDFSHIKEIAKYASRLGQCFSTTHAIAHLAYLQPVADVMRNGYCFTDGVGKISPFFAQMIASHFGLDTSDPPSVFQFRLAGCKGVLAVDPKVKGLTIHIRPSQQKFEAQSQGLEICKVSRYSSASLNMQLILVLSALGVSDDTFVNKMQRMISDMEEAMIDEGKALELLQKNIDQNQTTLQLASLINSGFMKTREPFAMSCLQLWRSWHLKYLKEKSRIFVDQSAFGFGCVDETATLQGHRNTYLRQHKKRSKLEHLPEIFLQISDTQAKGKYKIIEGVCILARNPSLHPGDIRVVRAVDVPALHHLKNCIVLPQTGDRDLANMCSGGDLDGDDYLVIWDKDLIPPQWNHPPMDYTPPPPMKNEDVVTLDDIVRFFTDHIKHDNLGRIATAHRYWADMQPDGVKDSRCLELARLHSMAVDYAKTGVPAVMPKYLKVSKWPHWAEVTDPTGSKKIYHSQKVLGKLYDEVQRAPFQPALGMSFDDRILHACEITQGHLDDAREVKALYDEAIRRIMRQHGIKTEFEVVTTFILEHNMDIGDYKFGETIAEAYTALREHYQQLCWAKVATGISERNPAALKPFLVAMYQVTAAEIATAAERTAEDTVETSFPDDMPLISFPWIFARELEQLASDRTGRYVAPQPAKAKGTLTPLNLADWRPATTRAAHGAAAAADQPVLVNPGETVQLFPDATDDLIHFGDNPLEPNWTSIPIALGQDKPLPTTVDTRGVDLHDEVPEESLSSSICRTNDTAPTSSHGEVPASCRQIIHTDRNYESRGSSPSTPTIGPIERDANDAKVEGSNANGDTSGSEGDGDRENDVEAQGDGGEEVDTGSDGGQIEVALEPTSSFSRFDRLAEMLDR